MTTRRASRASEFPLGSLLLVWAVAASVVGCAQPKSVATGARATRAGAPVRTITTVAGADPQVGRPITEVTIGVPNSLYIDAHGNLTYSDAPANVIRRVVAHTGIVETLVGNGFLANA